uniref:Uncharacterized protein n=1 Tax=Knipowitschia caucasica TaxID=637954 RepID=A0AAV2LZE6_KNICA
METRRTVRRIIKLENEDSQLAETIIHEHVEKQRLRLQQEELAQREAEARDKLSAEVKRELKQKREQQLLQIHLLQEQMKTRHQCGLESERRKAQKRWRRTEKCAQNNKRLLEERHKSQEQEERETQKKTEQGEYEKQVEMAIRRASMENRIALPLWGQRNGKVDNRLHFYKDEQGFIVNSKRKFEPRQSLILTDETPKKQVTVPTSNTTPKPKSVKRVRVQEQKQPSPSVCRGLANEPKLQRGVSPERVQDLMQHKPMLVSVTQQPMSPGGAPEPGKSSHTTFC